MTRVSRLAVSTTFLLMLATGGSPARGQTITEVHALLIFDTQATNIGKSVAIDKKNLWATVMQPLRDQKRLGYWEILQGDRAAPQNALQYFDHLKRAQKIDERGRLHRYSPRDTVLVYYSGHGATDPAVGHPLTMKRGKLPRRDLVNRIRQAGPALSVLVTDCCSTFMNIYTGTGGDANAGNWDTRKAPFLDSTGTIDLHSCQPGQSSLCNNTLGGFYTWSLMETLRKRPRQIDRSGNLDWQAVQNEVTRVLAGFGKDQKPAISARP